MNIVYVNKAPYPCGGMRIIIEHCNRLSGRGHNLFLAFTENRDVDVLRGEINSWKELVPEVGVMHLDHINDVAPDAVVATYFDTYYDIEGISLEDKCKKFYFIQQFEDRFFKTTDEKLRVLKTYEDNNYVFFTEAKWIQFGLKVWYGRDSYLIPNKQELPEIEATIKRAHPELPVVLIEGNALAKYKGVGEAWKVVKDLECEKWLLTNTLENQLPNEFNFDRVFCSVPWKEALSVIASADVLLKPSHFEGSPTPHMEAMELGTVVVTSNCSGVDEYCIDGKNCLVFPVGDIERMRLQVHKGLTWKKLRKKLIAGGKKTTKKFNDWKPSIDELEKMFKKEVRK